MGSLGPLEIFLVFLVILLIFGAKRIPEIARGLGKGISEFKRATQDMASEFNVEDQPRIDRQRSRRTSGQTAPRGAAQQQAQQQQAQPQQGAAQQQGQAAQPAAQPNAGDAEPSASNDNNEKAQ